MDVGDLLRFKARVLHVDFDNGKDNKVSSHDNTQCVDVEVECFVTRPEMVTSEVSNTFLFTFFVDSKRQDHEKSDAELKERRRARLGTVRQAAD